MVILIFIFLTPKSWFVSGERAPATLHQSRVVTLLIRPEAVGNQEDKGRIEQAVKELTGRTSVEILAVRKILYPDGRTRSFEVDIR